MLVLLYLTLKIHISCIFALLAAFGWLFLFVTKNNCIYIKKSVAKVSLQYI
uniref:Uncharacterized protein n=1 Tax=Staphylococcus arlettae TaxID=29378 RepID=A0A1W5QGG7_9STAP|nr:hypothetical protein [Staphylococcus arlettae]